jgi:hypothetical protein
MEELANKLCPGRLWRCQEWQAIIVNGWECEWNFTDRADRSLLVVGLPLVSGDNCGAERTKTVFLPRTQAVEVDIFLRANASARAHHRQGIMRLHAQAALGARLSDLFLANVLFPRPFRVWNFRTQIYSWRCCIHRQPRCEAHTAGERKPFVVLFARSARPLCLHPHGASSLGVPGCSA